MKQKNKNIGRFTQPIFCVTCQRLRQLVEVVRFLPLLNTTTTTIAFIRTAIFFFALGLLHDPFCDTKTPFQSHSKCPTEWFFIFLFLDFVSKKQPRWVWVWVWVFVTMYDVVWFHIYTHATLSQHSKFNSIKWPMKMYHQKLCIPCHRNVCSISQSYTINMPHVIN